MYICAFAVGEGATGLTRPMRKLSIYWLMSFSKKRKGGFEQGFSNLGQKKKCRFNRGFLVGQFPVFRVLLVDLRLYRAQLGAGAEVHWTLE